jgi:hypothetical protein
MSDSLHDEGRELVEAVRRAAATHQSTWEALVPNHIEINIDGEAAEDAAYEDMADAQAQLRDHICATYGISVRELLGLALI